MKDELYVAAKHLEQRNSVIEALNQRYDNEFNQFEDRVRDAVYEKDK